MSLWMRTGPRGGPAASQRPSSSTSASWGASPGTWTTPSCGTVNGVVWGLQPLCWPSSFLNWPTAPPPCAAFGDYNPTDAVVMMDKMTGRSRGFGFVMFANKRDQDAAIEAMHNADVDGRRISVTRAVPQAETAPGTPADALRKGQFVPREAGRVGGYRCAAGFASLRRGCARSMHQLHLK